MKKMLARQLVTLMVISLVAACSLPTLPIEVTAQVQLTADVVATLNAQVGIDEATRKVLEDGINALSPTAWQSAMDNMIANLGQVGVSSVATLLDDVKSTYNEALGQTQVTGFCSADFIPNRIKERLQAIDYALRVSMRSLQAKLNVGDKNTPEPLSQPVILPVVCSTDPVVMAVGETRNIKFYGYDFNTFGLTNFTADLVDSASNQVVKSNFGAVAVTSNYLLVIDVQSPDFAGVNPQQGLQLVLRWKGQQVSQEESGLSAIVVQFATPTPPRPPTATPTPTEVPPLPLIKIERFCDIGQPASHPTAQVTVPDGYKIVGGGAKINWTGKGNLLTSSYPESTQVWIASGKDHEESDPSTIEVCALALFDPEDLWDVRIFSETSERAAHPAARVSVLPDYTMVGGGARVNWDGIGNLLTASFPANLSTWEARSKDHIDSSPATITAFAIGIKAKDGNRYRKFPDTRLFTSVSPTNQHVVSGNVAVDSGYVLLSGGAIIFWSDPGMLLTESYPESDSSWAALGKDQIEAASGYIQIYAIGFMQP